MKKIKNTKNKKNFKKDHKFLAGNLFYLPNDKALSIDSFDTRKPLSFLYSFNKYNNVGDIPYIYCR